jgi:hypothetical protein
VTTRLEGLLRATFKTTFFTTNTNEMKTETKKFIDVIDNYSFEMFSERGNKACRSMMKKIYKKVGGRARVEKEDIFKFIRDEVLVITNEHAEIYDTEPQYHIADLTRKIFDEFGYNNEFDRYDIFL